MTSNPDTAAESPQQPVPAAPVLCTAALEIETLLRARYPLIGILSWEEERVMANLSVIGERLGKTVFEWTVTRGLVRHRPSLSIRTDGKRGTKDPIAALRELFEIADPAIVVLKDFHAYLKDNAVKRALRDLAQALRQTYVSAVILAPELQVPIELQKDLTLVDFPFPGREELRELIERIRLEITDSSTFSISTDESEIEALLSAALGLTLCEAENVFAKSLVLTGKLSSEEVPLIFNEKQQIVRKSGLLEYVPASERLEDIGGLEQLKSWLVTRRRGFEESARAFGVPPPKGVLMLGVQGCGKSLAAKATADLYRMPLLRLDMGAVFASFVGESESRVRSALHLAESVAPCVLWIDEIDKGLGGLSGSGSGDSGTTQRVFGTLVTWMQEHGKPVFVLATANNISALPPELLRKGRFDEIFFVDLPDGPTRREIFRIHLAHRKRAPERFDLGTLAELTPGFSGAEIEAAVVSGLFRALVEERDLETGDVVGAIRETYPLARTMAEDIQRLRQWEQGRARPAAAARLPE